MATCPNCSRTLPFFKVGFMTQLYPRIKCKSCSKILLGDESQLKALGRTGGASGGILGYVAMRQEDPGLWFAIFAGFLTVMILFLANRQYKTLKLTVAEDQDAEAYHQEQGIVSPPPPMPENPSRVEYLKNNFHSKSDFELESIANASTQVRTKEAKQAARELLDERKKQV